MGEVTKIQWCDHTFNPWMGCTKVSPGCKNCYAEALMDQRYGKVRWGPGNERSRTSSANWKGPGRWDRESAAAGERRRVFCASLADWLDPEVPAEWLADLLALIARTPHLDWLLLTKRPQLWRERMEAAEGVFLQRFGGVYITRTWTKGEAPPNVWLGVSVEDQARADERIPELVRIPARVRFLSAEPLLGPVDLSAWLGRIDHCDACQEENAPQVEDRCPACGREGFLVSTWGEGAHDRYRTGDRALANDDAEKDGPGLHWVIVGGESGPGARPMHVEWARSLVAQCRAAGIAPFVKQLGAHAAIEPAGETTDEGAPLEAHELVLADRKGGDPAEWPEDLRVREFPRVPA